MLAAGLQMPNLPHYHAAMRQTCGPHRPFWQKI